MRARAAVPGWFRGLTGGRPTSSTAWSTHSHALVVEHRSERSCHSHEFLLCPQHGADVFVCGGSLVTKLRGKAGVVPDPLHLPAEIPFAHFAAGRCPAQRPARAVGTRTQCLLVPTSLHLEAETAHGTWQNSALANFDLGSKLSSISALGEKKTGNDTEIKNFSSDVKVAPEGTQANNINLDVPAIGVLTGGGTVSPKNELAFKMSAAVAGMGIPFSIEGTTADPKFVPDVKGMAKGLVNGVLGGKSGPVEGLSGLFGKKKKQ